jgi:hypothetical protein
MIRAEVTDRAALAARLPSELAMYLRAHDWSIQARSGTSVQWVKTVDGEEFEALQPQESSIRDYPAAAYAVGTDHPRAVQPARKSADVLKLLRDVRIGPPAEGSFVLSVHTPVPPRLSFAQAGAAGSESADAEPFERLVSLKLYDAVQAAHNAANDALVDPNGLDAFTQVVPVGVSANLCEALVGLGGEAGHPFEFSLRLAPSRPLHTARLTPIRFRRDHLPVLASAARELRERVPEEGVVVEGNVVRLHREGSSAGEISIAGTIDAEDRLRCVWMSLSGEDYAVATRSHQEMSTVAVRGDLVRRGNRLYLTNPVGFRAVPDKN